MYVTAPSTPTLLYIYNVLPLLSLQRHSICVRARDSTIYERRGRDGGEGGDWGRNNGGGGGGLFRYKLHAS